MTKYRILIIDDDKDILRLLRKFLLNHNYEVFTALDGRDALSKLKQARPHLIITDLEMPKVNGYTFTNSLKRHPVGEKIPIIVLTAHSHYEDMRKSYAVGADFFLAKPVDLDKLRGVIEKFLTPGMMEFIKS